MQMTGRRMPQFEEESAAFGYSQYSDDEVEDEELTSSNLKTCFSTRNIIIALAVIAILAISIGVAESGRASNPSSHGTGTIVTRPTAIPTAHPSDPSAEPTTMPSQPSFEPSQFPTTYSPTVLPTTNKPTALPTTSRPSGPSFRPSLHPTEGNMCCESTDYLDSWQECPNGGNNYRSSDCGDCAAYSCIDWTMGSQAMISRQKTFKSRTTQDVYFGVGAHGYDSSSAGLCYRMSISGTDKDVIAQVVQVGGETGPSDFMIQTGDGGFGGEIACTSDFTQYPMYTGNAGQWQYLGAWNATSCLALPKSPICGTGAGNQENLQDMCKFSFAKGLRHDYFTNTRPLITKICPVACPSELYTATGYRRGDEPNPAYTCDPSKTVTSKGHLMNYFECAKPDYAWPENQPTDRPFVAGYENVIPCRRNGITRINTVAY
eukprot:gene10988-14762_t